MEIQKFCAIGAIGNSYKDRIVFLCAGTLGCIGGAFLIAGITSFIINSHNQTDLKSVIAGSVLSFSSILLFIGLCIKESGKKQDYTRVSSGSTNTSCC